MVLTAGTENVEFEQSDEYAIVDTPPIKGKLTGRKNFSWFFLKFKDADKIRLDTDSWVIVQAIRVDDEGLCGGEQGKNEQDSGCGGRVRQQTGAK
mgnify:CR=1 FL=1